MNDSHTHRNIARAAQPHICVCCHWGIMCSHTNECQYAKMKQESLFFKSTPLPRSCYSQLLLASRAKYRDCQISGYNTGLFYKFLSSSVPSHTVFVSLGKRLNQRCKALIHLFPLH